MPAFHSWNMQTMNISFGCSVPLMFIIFLVALSNDLTSSFDHPMIPAPCLITATARMLIADILFLPFNFDLNTSFDLLFYSLVNWSFISPSLILSISISSTPKYLYFSLSMTFMFWPSDKAIPSTELLFHVSVLKIRNVLCQIPLQYLS